MRVEPKAIVKRLTPTAVRMLEGAVGRAARFQHYEITVEHMLHRMLDDEHGDCAVLLRHFGHSSQQIALKVERVLQRLRAGNAGRPVFSESLFHWFEDSWLLASLEYSDARLRSGALLLQLLSRPGRYTAETWPELDAIPLTELKRDFLTLVGESPESNEAVGDASGAGGAGPRAPGAPAGDSALGRFATNLTEAARQGKIDPVFGREREIRQMIHVLSRRRKNNPILVGEPGVGKTAVVEGLARAIVDGDVPEPMRNVDVMTLDIGALQAGASVRGEFENRLRGVISEVKASPKPIVLFIDEAHTIIGAGGPQGGGDAANLLKPALARGELRTIAATTWAEFKKYFEKDAALERRFQPVKVEEPSDDDAIVMLRGLRTVYEKAHDVTIRDEAVEAAVKLSRRYLSGRQLPDKAVDLLDTTSARVRMERDTRPEPLVQLDAELAGLERTKVALARDHADGDESLAEELADVEARIAATKDRAASLRTRWEEQRDLLHKTLAARKAANDPNNKDAAPPSPSARELAQRLGAIHVDERLLHADVDADAVARTIAEWTGIPIGKMKGDTLSTVLTLEDRLKERVIGQEPAVRAVSEALRIAHADIRNPDSPIGVLLFVGPSGVGKTETALALADLLYGGERFLVTINMSEFQEKHTVSRLIGSPPGYVGYGEGGVLTEAVRQRPYSVVLLDECEKAHLDVMNLFYQVFDKGTLSDGEGREIDFRNTIIILTSNLASDQIMQLHADGRSPSGEQVATAIRPALSRHFKPALLARMSIVPFGPIAPDTMRTIAELKLSKLTGRLETAHGIETTFSDELLDELARRCTENETGARNLDHVLRGSLTPMIARELLERMAENTLPRRLVVSLAEDGGFQTDFH